MAALIGAAFAGKAGAVCAQEAGKTQHKQKKAEVVKYVIER